MSNPRSAVRFDQIGIGVATFLRKASSTGAIDYLPSVSNPYANQSTALGYSASMDIDSTVKIGADGDPVLGRINNVTTDGVVIQYRGFADFPYDPNTNPPVVGQGVLCDGSGGVKVAALSEPKASHTMCVSLNSTTQRAMVLIR